MSATQTQPHEPVLVRVHTHCLAGDIFGAALCDCRAIVDASLRLIAEAGRGALVYLHNTSAASASTAMLRAASRSPHLPSQQPRSLDDTSERPDTQRILRQVGLGGQILADLGIRKIRLLSNTPTHVPALQGFGIEIVERVPIELTHSTAR